MRLIDADAFLDRILPECKYPELLREQVESEPTVDPMKHGNWLLRHTGHGHYWECSVCNKNPCIYITEDTNYCPNCGSKMDEEV